MFRTGDLLTAGAEPGKTAFRHASNAQFLKQILHRELNSPSGGTGQCAGDAPETRSAQRRVRQAEVGRVRKIEDLTAKLYAVSLSYVEVLEQRAVQTPARRSLQDVPARVAHSIHGLR